MDAKVHSTCRIQYGHSQHTSVRMLSMGMPFNYVMIRFELKFDHLCFREKTLEQTVSLFNQSRKLISVLLNIFMGIQLFIRGTNCTVTEIFYFIISFNEELILAHLNTCITLHSWRNWPSFFLDI